MLKKIISILKKVIYALCLLYGFNLLCSSLNVNLAINLITVFVTTIFGFPGLCSLILIKIIVF